MIDSPNQLNEDFTSGPKLANILLIQLSSSNESATYEILEAAGYTVSVSYNALEALSFIAELSFDVVIVEIRPSSEPNRTSAHILPTDAFKRETVIRALHLGVDGYACEPIDVRDLATRVQASHDGRPVPAIRLRGNSRNGWVSLTAMGDEVAREIRRSARTSRPACLALVDLAERDLLISRFGPSTDIELRLQLSLLPMVDGEGLDLVSMTEDGQLVILMPDSDPSQSRERLAALSEHISRESFTAANEPVDVTPVIGFTTLDGSSPNADVMMDRAALAATVAEMQLDLQPVEWDPSFNEVDLEPKTGRIPAFIKRLRTPLQVLITINIGVVLPFIAYVLLDKADLNIVPVVYPLVVGALLITATLIWVEGFLALDPGRPPPAPAGPHPPASAIIAAYLPNEAATVMQTIDAFLEIDYPGPLQIILAYNTPKEMAIESRFHDLASKDPRFLPLKITDSTSKAQNVNAALAHATGEIVGVFDADHHPNRDCFRRAWRWIGNGFDVVQGHCVIRNGDRSVVAQTIAVEFESIYSVSHPGRARLHKFGIFGGSNGFWRTDVLRKIRMHGSMLTEDIDSSLRVVEAGGSIASDPALLSRELAPTTLTALWNQRMRWAQGWFQVSKKHFISSLGSSHLSIRQKFGFTVLLAWREVYPWVSLQILPLLAFFSYEAGGIRNIDLLIPIFLLTGFYTLSVGPGQTYFAYRLGAPEIRRHRVWYLWYILISAVFYTEMKNTIGRVAQIKELTGDRQWKVTPRVSPSEQQ